MDSSSIRILAGEEITTKKAIQNSGEGLVDEYYILRDRGSRKGNLSLLVLEIPRRSSTNGQSEMPNRNTAMIMGQGEHCSGCNNLQKAIPTRREGGRGRRFDLN